VAVDEGVLVKTGPDVLVSVRRAWRNGPRPIARCGGAGVSDPGRTHEQSVRSVMAKMESGFSAASRSFIMSEKKRKRERRADLQSGGRREGGAQAQGAASLTRGVWFGLGMMGLIGWSVVVPTLLGAALGLWLDKRHPGSHSWTLALLVAGLAIGCLNAWHWVAKEDKAMREEQEDDDE
jgi:ATP synthase protein I